MHAWNKDAVDEPPYGGTNGLVILLGPSSNHAGCSGQLRVSNRDRAMTACSHYYGGGEGRLLLKLVILLRGLSIATSHVLLSRW
jgi:hypothetical protein